MVKQVTGVKGLRKEFLTILGEKLTAVSFEGKPKGQSIRKPFNYGWVAVHITFINHLDDIDLVINLAIRFDKVEELIHRNNLLLSATEKKNTATLGVELGNWVVGHQKRWNITPKSNLHSVANSMFNYFLEFGSLYLEKYSNIDEAYELLSRDDSNAWLHSPNHTLRALKAVAIAKLFDKPDLKKLINSKKAFLEERKERDLKKYIKFVEDIDENIKAMTSSKIG